MSAMSKQIAVRLPEDVVDFIDREVDQRHVESRASFVLKALECERRRLIAARDAEILAGTTGDDDFDALAGHVSTLALDID
jgi:Arc/MetJ-type ribon-helix-helix transcriptional regulator